MSAGFKSAIDSLFEIERIDFVIKKIYVNFVCLAALENAIGQKYDF